MALFGRRSRRVKTSRSAQRRRVRRRTYRNKRYR